MRAEPDVLVMTANAHPAHAGTELVRRPGRERAGRIAAGTNADRHPARPRRRVGKRCGTLFASRLATVRQAFIVYPVIEGSKDDQPELDFSHDDLEAGVDSDPRLASQVSESRPGAPRPLRKGKTADLFSKAQQEASPAAKSGLKSAVEMHEKLRTGPLAGLRLGLFARPPGRRRKRDRHAPLPSAREIDVLVATTVVEVGVDVPNATVMVVEHAERFGMAQLHQLRGRVGRGAAKSYCILITGARVSPLGEERLNAMVRTQDGFELAELDLSMRGPGEFFGTRQGRTARLPRGQPGARPAIAGTRQDRSRPLCQPFKRRSGKGQPGY